MLPLLWAAVTSFKPPEAVNFGATYIPFLQFSPELTGWKNIFGGGGATTNLVPPLFNSVVITFGAAAISLVLGTITSYGLSRFRYKAGFIKNQDIRFFLYFTADYAADCIVISIFLDA